jgi:hypothetical protein
MAVSNSPVFDPRRKKKAHPLVLLGSAFAGGLVLALLRSQVARGAVAGVGALRRRRTRPWAW